MEKVKDDQSWTIPKVLKALRAVCDRIEGHRLHVSKEERQYLLPLLVILKRLTKRKKPGYHASLKSIGLTASTVRSWFYRGLHTNKIIALLEPEEITSSVRRKADDKLSESAEPGSREDKTRPIWMDQGIEVSYNVPNSRCVSRKPQRPSQTSCADWGSTLPPGWAALGWLGC
jgi:hypothetical protein